MVEKLELLIYLMAEKHDLLTILIRKSPVRSDFADMPVQIPVFQKDRRMFLQR